MEHVFLTALDSILLVGATLRMTRFVTTDALSQWWFVIPANRWAAKGERKWMAKYLDGLECGFCVGFWISLVMVVLFVALGPLGSEPVWWRVLCGALALNYVTAHISSKID